MRRLLTIAAVTSILALGIAAASAPAARAAPLPLALGGCMETPLPLSETARIARTCASWDGTNLALWVEGSGLAQEFTAVGAANFDLFGYVLTIEARAGMRAAPFGGWEAFFELTRPFAFGPLTVPLQVAEDGSRVTLWLSTAGLAAHSAAMRTDAASSFSLTFAGPDGTPRGTVVVPMALSPVRPPALPTPDLHPSTPGADVSLPPVVPPVVPEVVPEVVPVQATVRDHGAAPAAPAATPVPVSVVGGARVSLGRY